MPPIRLSRLAELFKLIRPASQIQHGVIRRNPRARDDDIIIGVAAKINDLPVGIDVTKKGLTAGFDDLEYLASSHVFSQVLHFM